MCFLGSLKSVCRDWRWALEPAVNFLCFSFIQCLFSVDNVVVFFPLESEIMQSQVLHDCRVCGSIMNLEQRFTLGMEGMWDILTVFKLKSWYFYLVAGLFCFVTECDRGWRKWQNPHHWGHPCLVVEMHNYLSCTSIKMYTPFLCNCRLLSVLQREVKDVTKEGKKSVQPEEKVSETVSS